MNQQPQKNKNLLTLALWLALGGALVIINYSAFALSREFLESEVSGWLNLFGGSIYILAGLLMLFVIDAMYVIMFLRWLVLGRKHKSKNTIIFP